MNMVMIVKDRPILTAQSLITLRRNTEHAWNLTIVDDNSEMATFRTLDAFKRLFPNKVQIVQVGADHPSSGVLGKLKNQGVHAAELKFGRDDWLYLSDNDVYFTKGWNTKMTTCMEDAKLASVRLLGGQNHPYHLPIVQLSAGVERYMAVAGTSWLMRWHAWDQYGPLDGNAKGTGQSEDTAFCQRIIKAGFKVAAMSPHVVFDTGLTQTDGSPSVGCASKLIVSGVAYE